MNHYVRLDLAQPAGRDMLASLEGQTIETIQTEGGASVLFLLRGGRGLRISAGQYSGVDLFTDEPRTIFTLTYHVAGETHDRDFPTREEAEEFRTKLLDSGVTDVSDITEDQQH